MTAPVAKAEALHAARIAPWVELLSPKAPAGGGPAEAVSSTPRVDNDVLLPQGAPLRAQPSAAGEAPRIPAAGAGTGVGTGPRSSSTDLSLAARLIQDLLADRPEGPAQPVRGQAPVWPAACQAPAAAALAAALSQQMSESGLFYESHLAQFAAGARSIAQMLREPQAGLARSTPEAADGALPSALPARPTAGAAVSAAAPQAQAAAMPAVLPPAVVAGAPMHVEQAPARAPVETAQAPSAQGDAAATLPHASNAADRPVPAPAQSAALARYADAAQMAAERAPAAAQPASAELPAAVAVHPQAAPLVHQQLDLLASAMFRWSGEAWPGVPMEWSVQEEGARPQGEQDAPSAPQWSTALTLELPRLGKVDVRMQLEGSRVRAQMAAPQPDALMQLRANRSTLSQRLAGAGFELRALQLDPELAP